MTTIEKLKKLDSEKNIPEIDFLIDNLLKLDLKTVNSLSSLKNYLESLEKFNLKILRTCSIDPYLKILKGVFATRKFDLNVEVADYGQVETEIYSNQNFSESQDAVLVFERIEDILPSEFKSLAFLSETEEKEVLSFVSQRIEGMIEKYKASNAVPFIYTGYFGDSISSMSVSEFKHSKSTNSFIDKINSEIKRVLSIHSGCFYLDIVNSIYSIGHDNFFDSRMNSMYQAPFSTSGFIKISEFIANIAWTLKGRTKKCLVLDCDNTLWGGIIGEDKMEGIKLGPEYPGIGFTKFQRFAKSLTRHGIILALNSKNNEQDALEVFTDHPHSVLKTEDIASHRINWNTKVQNIQEIADELNIGIDSLVFVDDSDFECQMVKQAYPQIAVKQIPKDELSFEDFIRSFYFFESPSFSKEDGERSKMYQAQVKRKKLESSFTNVEDFYKSLEIQVDFYKDYEEHISRISQLSNKTNQFNLTTKRYSEDDIKNFMESNDSNVFSLSASDKFGNNGITGVCITKNTNGVIYIDSLFLSCRIIGRGIEKSFLAHVLDTVADGKVESEFIKTAKNQLVENFFDDLNFTVVDSNEEHKKYSFDSISGKLEHPAWISWSVK